MQMLNIEQLPESARNELIDFYEFLLSKYVCVKSKPKTVETQGFKVPREVKPFEPLTREACYER